MWELAHPSVNAKALRLTAIGVNPTTATTINLVYSAAAFGVFYWIAARRWRGGRDRAGCPEWTVRAHDLTRGSRDRAVVRPGGSGLDESGWRGKPA
jgi:hypothetical protein